MTKLLTLQQVCEALGCDDPKGRMVRNLRKDGKLVGVKIGRNLMFTERSVSQFIDNEIRKQNKRPSIE